MYDKGASRYDVKAEAGWSRIRSDGSSYSRQTDIDSHDAEVWFADAYGGIVLDDVALKGDEGYDVIVKRGSVDVRVDVVYAGRLANGDPRPGIGCNLIVNVDSNKLICSDLIVLVEGPPFRAVGAIYTSRFVAIAQLRDHRFGLKYSLPTAQLTAVDMFLKRRNDITPSPTADQIFR